MATDISRDLSAINAEIKNLNASVKSVNGDLRETQKAIALNPGNVAAVANKYKLLSQQVDTTTKRIVLLRSRQDELTRQQETGQISQSRFAAQMKKTATEVDRTEKELAQLTAQMQMQNAEITKAKFANWTNQLNKAQAAAQKFSRAAMVVVAALAAATYAFVKMGDEIGDTSAKLNTSAEDLQIGRNLYEKVAGGASEYDSALSALGSTMSSIAKGRGKAYLTALQQIGLTTEKLAGKDTGTQLALVTQALSGIDDEALRTQQAMILLGEAGRSVSLIAGENQTTLNGYTQALIDNGLISNDQIATAGTLANSFDSVKLQLQSATAELVVALLPAITALVEILQTTIIPILNTIAAGLEAIGPSGQKILLIILAVVIILPKLIAIIKSVSAVIGVLKLATYGQAAATGTLSAASLPLQPILLAIAAALLVVIALIGIFSKTARNAAKEATSLGDSLGTVAGDYEALNKEVGLETTSISQSSATKNINLNLDLNMHGDTPLSDNNAEILSKYLSVDIAKRVNAELGGLI